MNRILLISANALGDTYLSCSAIEPLKKHFENVMFDLITLEECNIFTPYLELNEVFFLKKRSARELLKAKSFLNARKYDFVFSFFPGRMNSFLAISSRSDKKYFYKNILKSEDWYKSSQFVYHNADNTKISWQPEMNFLDRIKIVIDYAFDTDNEVKKPVFRIHEYAFSKTDGEVVINFSSRFKNKSLEIPFVEELSEYITKVFSKKVCLLDFKNEFGKTEKKLIFPGDYDFKAILGRIICSELFISVDSFLHPADAYGVNMLGVFGPTNPGSALTNGRRNYIKVNPLRNLRLEDIIPPIRNMLNAG